MSGCCGGEKREKINNEEHQEQFGEIDSKGGKMKGDLKTFILWGVIALLAIAVLYVLFFSGDGSSSASSISAAKSASQAAQSSYGGMVGGC